MLWSVVMSFAIPALSQNDGRDGPSKSSCTRGSWSNFVSKVPKVMEIHALVYAVVKAQTSVLRSLFTLLATNNIWTLIKYYHLLVHPSSLFKETCKQSGLTSLAPLVLLLGGSVRPSHFHLKKWHWLWLRHWHRWLLTQIHALSWVDMDQD